PPDEQRGGRPSALHGLGRESLPPDALPPADRGGAGSLEVHRRPVPEGSFLGLVELERVRDESLMCTRREFLVGSVFGLTLADALAWGRESKTKSCILVWLNGGPSHLDMFDLKPDAPVEI